MSNNSSPREHRTGMDAWTSLPLIWREIFYTFIGYVVLIVAVIPLFMAIAGRPLMPPAMNLPLYVASIALLVYRNRSHKHVFLASADNVLILRKLNILCIILNATCIICSFGI